jgi:hypothetical protein
MPRHAQLDRSTSRTAGRRSARLRRHVRPPASARSDRPRRRVGLRAALGLVGLRHSDARPGCLGPRSDTPAAELPGSIPADEEAVSERGVLLHVALGEVSFPHAPANAWPRSMSGPIPAPIVCSGRRTILRLPQRFRHPTSSPPRRKPSTRSRHPDSGRPAHRHKAGHATPPARRPAHRPDRRRRPPIAASQRRSPPRTPPTRLHDRHSTRRT